MRCNMEAKSSPGRIENLTGVACDEIEREFGSMHSFKHGNLCNSCQSRVNPAQMVPLHDDDGAKYLTCPHCGTDLINLR